MEDASGVDLDWFWRGWFFTNDHVDLAISDVKVKSVLPKDPVKKNEQEKKKQESLKTISAVRNKSDIKQTYNERDTTLNDFYTSYDPLITTEQDKAEYEKTISGLSNEEKELQNSTSFFYEIEIERIGDLVMPVIYEIIYENGNTELIRIPAEIWRKGERKITRVHKTDNKILKFNLDPYLETADIDTSNNSYPREDKMSQFEIFKRRGQGNQENPMQKNNKLKSKIQP